MKENHTLPACVNGKQGFTLLELSIVLVIIGLIIGGITVGQDLIRSAELQKIAKEYQQYQTAISTFRLKYNSFPGDMSNAESYWGTAHATDGTCITTNSAGVATTCNGDGDGVLESVTTRSNEYFRFWQHLGNSGILASGLSGVAGSGSATDAEIATNVPASGVGAGGWTAGNMANFAGDADAFALDYGNYLVIGSEGTTETHDALLTPQEAAQVDNKVDDGLPARGIVIARFWDDACTEADDGTEANNDLAASYKLSDDTTQCALYFRKVW